MRPDVRWSWPAKIVLTLSLAGALATFFWTMVELS